MVRFSKKPLKKVVTPKVLANVMIDTTLVLSHTHFRAVCTFFQVSIVEPEPEQQLRFSAADPPCNVSLNTEEQPQNSTNPEASFISSNQEASLISSNGEAPLSSSTPVKPCLNISSASSGEESSLFYTPMTSLPAQTTISSAHGASPNLSAPRRSPRKSHAQNQEGSPVLGKINTRLKFESEGSASSQPGRIMSDSGAQSAIPQKTVPSTCGHSQMSTVCKKTDKNQKSSLDDGSKHSKQDLSSNISDDSEKDSSQQKRLFKGLTQKDKHTYKINYMPTNKGTKHSRQSISRVISPSSRFKTLSGASPVRTSPRKHLGNTPVRSSPRKQSGSSSNSEPSPKRTKLDFQPVPSKRKCDFSPTKSSTHVVPISSHSKAQKIVKKYKCHTSPPKKPMSPLASYRRRSDPNPSRPHTGSYKPAAKKQLRLTRTAKKQADLQRQEAEQNYNFPSDGES